MKINEHPSEGTARKANPGSARERVTKPPAGTALAPFQGSSRETPSDERALAIVTEVETYVNKKATRLAPARPRPCHPGQPKKLLPATARGRLMSPYKCYD